MILRWRIYYADGTTFDNTQGDCYDAPFHGVVCINVRDLKLNTHRISHFDYYYWCIFDETWQGSMSDNILLILGKYSRDRVAPKFGETVSHSLFDALISQAKKDIDFLKTSPALNPIGKPYPPLFKGREETD